MKKILIPGLFALSLFTVQAQPDQKTSDQQTKLAEGGFQIEKILPATPVKNQQNTGTCWSFSTTSLLESQMMKKNPAGIDLSEMYTVRNIYIDKARNYILRQGHAQFSEGGLGHDVINSIAKYGEMPQEAYSGLANGKSSLDHSSMFPALKHFLDSIIKSPVRPISPDWINSYNLLLDQYLGTLSQSFTYNGKQYTPKTFSSEVMNFKQADYINITSFTHHPFYQPFILEVPDNFSNGAYYNLPLEEMLEVVKNSIKTGYTVLWDADVSNSGFMQGKGIAILRNGESDNEKVNADVPEPSWNATLRQQLFENLTTQDDHLMHITGMEKSGTGKTFFLVKNSWGNIGPYEGYINVSEGYLAINTISLVVPKVALSKSLLAKLGIK